MTEDDQILRKRLRFRSWHRGTREMDLILGRFADANLAAMDRGQLDRYGRLLENSDPDIYNWLVGRGSPPDVFGEDQIDGDLWRLLTASIHRSRNT